MGESAYSEHFAASEWQQVERGFVLRPDLYIARPIWWPWRPLRVCVDGVVRKVHTEHGHTESCPVPFVKVEIFDVDREFCWWPYIIRWWDVLIQRPVVRIPDLIGPIGPPDPIGPVARFINPGVIRGFNPQPDPPGDPQINPGRDPRLRSAARPADVEPQAPRRGHGQPEPAAAAPA